MKNLHSFSALLCMAALTLSGCSNEELPGAGTSVPQDFTLVATIGSNTKTTVAKDYKVNWTVGDAFYAFGGATGTENVYKAKAEFSLTSGENTTSGRFSGKLLGEQSDLEYAVYPLSQYESSTMILTFPATYTYPDSNAPMFGKLNADKTAVEFGQLLSGMMRIRLNGLATAVSGSLRLEAADITGSAPLTISEEGVASLGTFTSDNTNAVTLNFTGLSGNVVLDVPVPAGTYQNGIKATLAIDNAEAEVFNTTTGFVMKAGVIKEMPAISNISIDGSTGGLVFSKDVETVGEANKVLADGGTQVTIAEVKADEEIVVPATTGTAEKPAIINITEVGENVTLTVKGGTAGEDGSTVSTQAVVINVPAGSKGTLIVEGIEHVEISGDWDKVDSSTGGNTLVVKAGANVTELEVKKGNVEIEKTAVVQKLTLQTDVTINKELDIQSGKTMEVMLNGHTLTFNAAWAAAVSGELKLTGTDKASSKVVDNGNGIALITDNAKFTMTNVTYTATRGDASGILIDKYVTNGSVTISNSDMKSGYFCISTNASVEVGNGCAITLTNSTFTAIETAFLVNIPATVTATNCTFTGGWQGAFLRGGTYTFDNCGFHLYVDSEYGASNVAEGATAWKTGNQAPSAAITAGNRTKSAYDYPTAITMTNGCAFSCKVDNVDSQTYPSIYLDAETDKENQGVTLTADDGSVTNYGAAGKGLVNQNETKCVVNGGNSPS